MDSEQKARVRLLVDALRSGDYKQGRGALCHVSVREDGGEDRRYCCMGVACEIARAHGVTQVLRERDSGTIPLGLVVVYGTVDDPNNSYLPQKVRDWFGFDSTDPIVDGRRLSGWNDGIEEDFNSIANRIERAWLSDV
jgi:hypothetical protein